MEAKSLVVSSENVMCEDVTHALFAQVHTSDELVITA